MSSSLGIVATAPSAALRSLMRGRCRTVRPHSSPVLVTLSSPFSSLYDSDLSAKASPYCVGCELPFGSGQLCRVYCSLAQFSLVLSQHFPEGWNRVYASSAWSTVQRQGTTRVLGHMAEALGGGGDCTSCVRPRELRPALPAKGIEWNSTARSPVYGWDSRQKSNLLPVFLPRAEEFPTLSVSIISQASFTRLEK